MFSEPVFSVSDFVAVFNQTLELAYPSVVISGELANLRVSKNRWIYFDLKDELATVKFFGTVYQLPGPLENGLMLQVRGQPRLHTQYGFSVNVMSIQPIGEGSINRAAELLKLKLTKEGLFEPGRKRDLPYPPTALVGLITSRQSAAYADFIKVLNNRWGGLEIKLIDVQVQGEQAPQQIIQAIEQFNALADPPEALVIIRGGGSADDLAAFSHEGVTRAVAGSRIPTIVAIGHEVDISLAELAADQRASTPSNAAEMLVPDRQEISKRLKSDALQLHHLGKGLVSSARLKLATYSDSFSSSINQLLARRQLDLKTFVQLLTALSPQATLRRGYAIVRSSGQMLRSTVGLKEGAIVEVQLSSGEFKASVKAIEK